MSRDLRDHMYGIVDERHAHVNALLRDYSPRLSLRKIDPGDRIYPWAMSQTPPRQYGVWEDGVATGESNWAFTLAEQSIDLRVLARVAENDMSKRSGAERFSAYMLLQAAEERSRQLKLEEQQAERREEMLALGRLAGQKSSFRHVIDGEAVIIGDEIRPVRKAV